MNIRKCSLQLPAFLFAGILFLLTGMNICFGQNERNFSNYPGHVVEPLTENYDHSLMIQVCPANVNDHLILMQYGLEGTVLWKKEFLNSRWIRSMINTSDSGFIMTTEVFTHPVDSVTVDTSGNIAILKYDKCARLQWGRYIKSAHEGAFTKSIIEDNNCYYVFCIGINGYDNHLRKPITLLKLDKNGNLLKTSSFEGFSGKLVIGSNPDTLYLTQELYVPYGKDTSGGYAFSGIKILDTSFNILASKIIGYDNKILNGIDNLLVSKKYLSSVNIGFDLNNKQETMFGRLTKSLSLRVLS